MSIFGSIMSKIFGTEAKAETPTTPAASAAAPKPAPGTTAPGATTPAASAPSANASPATAAAKASGPATSVDVNAVLSAMAAKESQKLDWKHSIVDLMKLLDLDSSLAARKELAKELHYTGSTDDSAAMNMWLHRQVMQKLAENGGKVPEELKV